MEKKQKEPRGYYVEKGSFFAHASVTILLLSMAARLLGTMNLWYGEMMQLLVQVLLPVGCSVLFIVFILLLGRIALWSTILPVLGGAAFFILSVINSELGWPMFVCIALAFLAAFIYTATLSGLIRGKWLLVLVFALILAYQIIFRAIPVFSNTQEPVSFVDGMTMLSSLGIVLAMLLASISFRRKKSVKEEPELPAIKDPVPAKPSETENAESPVAPEAAPAAEAPSEISHDEKTPVPDASMNEPLSETEKDETVASSQEVNSQE